MFRSPILALCALLVLGGFLTTALTGQDDAANADDLTKRVAALEAQVKKMSEMTELRDDIVRKLHQRVAVADVFFARVPAAMVAFSKSIDEAEKAGFTYPAPNPESKKILLAALRRLGSSVAAAAAPKKK